MLPSNEGTNKGAPVESMRQVNGKCGWFLILSAVFTLSVAPRPSVADEEHFMVRTAYTELIDGVYYLNADIEFSISPGGLEALRNSVPLLIELEIEVERERTLMWNEVVAELRQRYELVFHPLSRRYVVRNLNTGTQQVHTNYRSAISRVGQISDLPVIDESLLEGGERYRIRMRTIMQTEGQPGSVGFFTWLWSDSSVSSDWYEWTLRS